MPYACGKLFGELSLFVQVLLEQSSAKDHEGDEGAGVFDM